MAQIESQSFFDSVLHKVVHNKAACNEDAFSHLYPCNIFLEREAHDTKVSISSRTITNVVEVNKYHYKCLTVEACFYGDVVRVVDYCC